jgi:hypothetical protein
MVSLSTLNDAEGSARAVSDISSSKAFRSNDSIQYFTPPYVTTSGTVVTFDGKLKFPESSRRGRATDKAFPIAISDMKESPPEKLLS